MKKFFSTLIAVLFLLSAQAQHGSPLKMLYQPRQNFITFSGAGGGNLFSLFKAAGSASGILAIDGNIKIGKDMLKNKSNFLKSVGVSLRANLFNNTLLKSIDSLDIRRMVFQDNDFRIVLGGRYNLLKEKKENPNERFKTFATTFFDLVITPYRIDKSNYGNKGMTNVSLNLGGKFGFLTKWGIGLFGITINPQIDMLFIANSKFDYALEESVRVAFSADSFGDLVPDVDLARSYIGLGTKIEIPLNDFSLFFDFRKYFKAGPGEAIDGLSDRLLFSVGGMAIGSIFKNKDKEAKNTGKTNTGKTNTGRTGTKNN